MRLGPFDFGDRGWWRYQWTMKHWCGIFRNKPGIRPGRWGFYLLGFEFGNCNPGGRFGCWLKRRGLWPW